VWELWKGDGDQPLYTCAIITTAANEVVGKYHDRMPVVLTRDQFTPWLAAASTRDELQALLRALPASELEAVPVGQYVNNARHEWPECLRPVAA